LQKATRISVIACLCLVVLGIKTTVYASSEDHVIYTLVELTIHAQTVYEAKCIGYTDDTYTFCGHPLGVAKMFADTFLVGSIDYLYNPPDSIKSKYRSHIRDADLVLLYGSFAPGGIFEPLQTGFRLLTDSVVFTPYSAVNFNLGFFPSDDKISWAQLKVNAMNIISRVNHVKALRAIPDPGVRNQVLFDWLEKNRHTFNLPWKLNEDEGWGSLEWEIFNWIVEGNIGADTWKASQLYRNIRFPMEDEWQGYGGILQSEAKGSFDTLEDMEWLIAMALDEKIISIERRQALYFFCSALGSFVYRNKRTEIITPLTTWKEKITPLTGQPELADFASKAIRSLGYQMGH
jgi:hypothetical protein